jgi:hypothetical protein
MVKEVSQPVGYMWSDDECVVNLMEPAERLTCSPIGRHLLGILHEDVDDQRKQ